MKNKRGPKTEYVRDHENHTVNGLRIQKTKDASGNPFERYYAVIEENAKPTRKLFGSSKDKPAAIEAYRRWMMKSQRELVAIGSRVDDVETYIKGEIDAGEDDIELTIDPDGTILEQSEVPASAFWDLVRKLINETPKLVAQKTGIEQIGYLDKVEPPKPSPKLNTLCDEYLKRVNLSEGEERNTKTWWKEFCRIVDAKTVKGLNFHEFLKYADRVNKDRISKQRTAYYVRNRIIAIQKIINSAGNYQLIDASEMKRIQRYLQILWMSS